MTQLAIAAAMGVSLSTVNRAHMAYDRGGIKALKPKPIGGRQRENMTLSEEEALLARFGRAAGAGEMLNIHDLKAGWLRERVETRVPIHLETTVVAAVANGSRVALELKKSAEAKLHFRSFRSWAPLHRPFVGSEFRPIVSIRHRR
jgi:hypothetical protein